MDADRGSRTKVREAAAKHKQAQQEEQIAAQAVEQGAALVREKERELSQLDSVERDTAAAAANRILDAARDDATDLALAPCPNVAVRMTVERELAMAKETLRVLTGKREEASKFVANAFSSLRKAITEDLSESGDLLADELAVQNERVALLKATLLGLGMLRIEPDKPFPLSMKVREALAVNERQHAPGQDPVKWAQESWRKCFDLLLTDPDADLEILLPHANRTVN